MIVLRNKQFAFGLNQLGRAISGVGKNGQKLGKMARMGNAAGGIGGLALTGLAVGGAYTGAKTVGATKDAMTGKMGEENGAGY